MTFSLTVYLWGPAISAMSSQTQEQSPLRKIADIPLPGKAVCFDYQSLDATSGRLYMPHLNADELVVFDNEKREVVANLDSFPRVHGVWAVPRMGKVYASATGEHQVAVVDMRSLKTIAKPGPVQYPEGIAYVPGPKPIFVSDEHGIADAVIDATTDTLQTTIPLDGGAGNTVYDPGSGHILVAVHEKNQLVAIDPATGKIVGRYPVTGIGIPHGIALDLDARPAFVAGQENNKLALVDLTNMQVLARYQVGKDTYVLAFDPGLKRFYVSAESGNVTIFREQGRALVNEGSVFMPHAHTVSVNPKTRLVYFPLENIDGRPLLRIMQPTTTN